jgi:hypothetical protein
MSVQIRPARSGDGQGMAGVWLDALGYERRSILFQKPLR